MYMFIFMCTPCMYGMPWHKANSTVLVLACAPVGSCELLVARGPVGLQVLRLQLLPQLPSQHGTHRLADEQQGPCTHVLLCYHTPAATWWHVGHIVCMLWVAG
jgi:hypothetical protein